MKGDEQDSIPVSLPWVGNLPWVDPGSLHHPKVRVPGGPGPDDVLPCAGKWKLFDQDVVTTRARRLCEPCAFNDWCFETALQNREAGIWAGTSQDERRVMGPDARRDVA